MKRLEYLKPLLYFFIIGLVVMTLSRIVLVFIFSDRITATENFWYIFPLGLRMDIIMMSYLSFIPAILISILPKAADKFTSKFLTIYCTVLLFFVLFMELTTPDFIEQYDTRPNKLFLDYLIYPKEVATMLIKARPLSIVLILAVMALGIWGATKITPRLFKVRNTSYKYRLILFPIVAFLLFWGARGSLTSKRPINASNSVFSNDQLTNVMGVNSLYTVVFAAYSMKHESNPSKLYGNMEPDEAYRRVKKYIDVTPKDFTDPQIPLLHIQHPDSVMERPYNIVIFLQESLGAEYVGCLGGLPLTPNLDKWAEEGLLFTNLYCTGTRSVRGIEAVTTGFLPSPSESVVKLSNSQSGFFTLADLLSRKGYNTSFIYGGMANFDNMASFFNGNGFQNILDESSFDKDGAQYAMKGTWGYSDEDLAVKANNYFKSLGDKPFFSLMFSTSNHEPFEFPDGRIELYEQPKNTVHNAMKYADYAIGKLLDLAKEEAYFDNTVFIIVADHNTRTYGKNLVPVNKFHIPALIIAPNIDKGIKYERLCSQIDIPATLLSIAGVENVNPMPGRDLMTLPDSVAGRSIMQFHEINGFRVEDQIVIMQPNKEALQFQIVNDTTFIPATLDPELAKDALAHVLAAFYLYKDRKYTIDDRK
ncbi:LTA synthase family protein [Dysgonomonas sp. 216]|uniref:LTA synthase family protein n=1 Tax=Dysgonomonas sp. 216 TaxID=2302934 RepID=UPI0013D83846|nr:LTA synthase family protein [Dysgonomonas sp. 216]NDW19794.1 LTA synthase family protein [Dysgonomonas sp. 216]